MKKAKDGLIYLYCITRTKPSQTNFEEIGVKVYPVYFQGTYAVVANVSPDEFAEENFKVNLANIEWVEKRARQHEKVIEEIMKDITVIPFKFGTIFEAEKNVEKLLRDNNLKFKNMIAGLEGKEEWGLKIYCDLKQLENTLQAEDERIKEKDKEITSAGKGKAYFLKKKMDKFIKDIVNERISEYTQDCFERLKRTSVDTRINKILPKEVTEKKEDMVLNAAFLINKKRTEEFDTVLKYLKTKYSVKELIFVCTGPWPPYNFCSLSEQEKAKNE